MAEPVSDAENPNFVDVGSDDDDIDSNTYSDRSASDASLDKSFQINKTESDCESGSDADLDSDDGEDGYDNLHNITQGMRQGRKVRNDAKDRYF